MRSTRRRALAAACVITLFSTFGACRDITQQLPPGTVDPDAVRTPRGAIQLYNGVRLRFVQRILSARELSVITDELRVSGWIDVTNLAGKVPGWADARNLDSATTGNEHNQYSSLHDVRNQLGQAIRMLALFPDETPAHYRGELFVLQGLVLTYFAEYYCSGIPMTTVDFDGDFRYSPGIDRDSVLRLSLASYDSAQLYIDGDTLLPQMIASGRARSWLQLDSIDKAAEQAELVQPGFRYSVRYSSAARPAYRISDREGLNGLPYRSSGDPRIGLTVAAVQGSGDTTFYLQREPSGTFDFVLMRDIEAMLILAERDLRAGNANWLARLNALRTDGTFTMSGADTMWRAGTGGVARLRPLTDPALETLSPGKSAFDVRVDLLMRERAFWLFLTGHRQGDLRRLIRQYQRDAESVFPTGAYGRNGALLGVRYGDEVAYPPVQQEALRNPYYHGCFNHDA